MPDVLLPSAHVLMADDEPDISGVLTAAPDNPGCKMSTTGSNKMVHEMDQALEFGHVS